MGSRLTRLAFVALSLPVALALEASAAGQQQSQAPQQPPTFRTGVRLVRVDATVTGKGDKPVADLQASDFEVNEDGIPQRVDQLQFVKLDGNAPPGEERSLTIRSQEHAEAEASREDVRVFGIFLDDYHIDKSPAITLPLRRVLTRLVNQLWPTDLVVMMDPLTPLSAMRFTRLRSELIDVINKFEGRQGELFPIKSPIEEAQLMRSDVVRVRAEVTLSALASLVIRLGGLKEGRKVVMFVSQGPPTFFGRDGTLQDRMREIAQAASRGNVTIYPVDPRGLGMVAQGARDTLFQLAAESGGRAITDTNDPTAGLNRILSDASTYYILGYQPTRTEDDGKYHKISVKVRRPGVHVLARQGYWAPSSKEIETAREAAARRPPPAVAGALETYAEQDQARRHLADVWVGASPGSQGLSRVAIAWEKSEAVSAGGAQPSALDVEVLEPKTGTAVEPQRTIPLSTPGAAQRAEDVFLLRPGPVALRITARSAADSVVDRWVQPFVVPDFGRAAVSLSTPRLYRARSLPELRAIRESPEATPGASRRFARTDRVIVALDCYTQAGGGQAAIEAHLLTRDGRELAPLPLPQATGTAIRFELPMTSLGQGTYILRIRARVGAEMAEQLVVFSLTR